MKITIELVDTLSRLSRLQLPEEERAAMTGQLERIVAYMDTLDKLDTRGVAPMRHVLPVKNVLREDVVEPSQAREELLSGAPASDGETFLVPKAVE